MKTKTIFEAVLVLDKAGRALRCGNLNIAAQMDLGRECYEVATALQLALERALPEVKIDRHHRDL